MGQKALLVILYGLDFTSAPSPRKPITCACLHLEGSRLVLDSLEGFHDWSGFERFLQRQGEWLAGIDFPFGQPARFVQAMGWGDTWAAYVGHIARMSAAEWEANVRAYSAGQPMGDKQHQRTVDRLAASLSPMKLDYTPVGKMFYQGAPRLLASGVNIPGLNPTQAKRTVLEAYPKLVVKALLGGYQPYKAESRPKQTAQQHAQRTALWSALQGPPAEAVYGLRLVIPRPLQVLGQQILNDATGDSLDAVLAGLQAAWAGRHPRYGQPQAVHPLEGWIADPQLAGL
jgi:hypothetical protein